MSSGNGVMAGTNYRGNIGDTNYWHYENMRSDHDTDNNRERYTFPTRGVITNGLYEVLGIESLSDGTSNTIILSEAAITPTWGGNTASIKGGVAFTSGIGTESNGYAATCAARRDGSNVLNPAASQIGGRWVDAYPSYTGFYTILPPNSPTCFNQTTGTDYAFLQANSYHTGGVNACFGDGAVRFVSDSVNAVSDGVVLTTQPVQRFQGESPFGVWGALGTRACGEAKSL
jgi:prepilin-type processing-associated H-X9-DG protein